MLAIVEMNRFGHIEVAPVSERFQRRMARLSATDSDGTIYVQHDVDTWLDSTLARGAARDVREGWTVRCRIDSWAYAVWCGAT